MRMGVRICLTVAVLVVGCLLSTQAALQREEAHDPDFPGKCLGRFSGIILDEGGTKQLNTHCGEVRCDNQGGTMVLTTITCGVAQAGPGCQLVEYPSLNHPDCCPQIVCN